jgi:hypothetical protein
LENRFLITHSARKFTVLCDWWVFDQFRAVSEWNRAELDEQGVGTLLWCGQTHPQDTEDGKKDS